jgi:hypothetical protein
MDSNDFSIFPVKEIRSWYTWWAWYPIFVNDKEWVWLDWVERRDILDRIIVRSEFRRIGEKAHGDFVQKVEDAGTIRTGPKLVDTSKWGTYDHHDSPEILGDKYPPLHIVPADDSNYDNQPQKESYAEWAKRKIDKDFGVPTGYDDDPNWYNGC